MNIEFEQRFLGYLVEVESLKIGGTRVVEFEEGIGVMLTQKGYYSAYFLSDMNVSCNGLCLRKNCIFHDEPIFFKFIKAIECVNFIFINMFRRTDRITLLVSKIDDV
ncbi:hypothetical protein ACOI1C_14045 [Bacillus sp. DJP31]|uniref:hypothetical protein n=1 Tax=Bacillus sp. DJP31 TaxID=3409789 RepID=UPI003BB6A453